MTQDAFQSWYDLELFDNAYMLRASECRDEISADNDLLDVVGAHMDNRKTAFPIQHLWSS
jgi:hypothetical protein